MPEPAILKGQVHVWCADPDELDTDDRKTSARSLLTREEVDRLERYHFESDRRIHLATRVLVRTVLSRYEPVPPAAWRFVAGEQGRPEIASPESSLRFNLSNTKGLVACAVARAIDVGVDVELLEQTVSLDVAEKYFSPSEVAALRDLPSEARPRRFLDLWTLKESYIKARGLGLSLPLDRFSFSLDGDHPPRLEIDPSLGDRGDSWQCVQLEPTSRHLLALCIRRQGADDAEVVLRNTQLRISSKTSR
jgi:4'-phosphopantetheinyl transferase